MMWILLGLTLVVSGCETNGDDDDVAGDDDDDDATDDDTGDDDTVDPCTDTELMRADALENGMQILDGVTLEASTPIADLVTDPAAYEEEVVQIEGWVVELCASEGCYAILEDDNGEEMMVKTSDGAVDHSDYTEPNKYHVAEGVFTEYGAAGPWLWIMDHGAMAGTIVCD